MPTTAERPGVGEGGLEVGIGAGEGVWVPPAVPDVTRGSPMYTQTHHLQHLHLQQQIQARLHQQQLAADGGTLVTASSTPDLQISDLDLPAHSAAPSAAAGGGAGRAQESASTAAAAAGARAHVEEVPTGASLARAAAAALSADVAAGEAAAAAAAAVGSPAAPGGAGSSSRWQGPQAGGLRSLVSDVSTQMMGGSHTGVGSSGGGHSAGAGGHTEVSFRGMERFRGQPTCTCTQQAFPALLTQWV